MKNWQHWMQQGNHAWGKQELAQARACYEQALSDVWPIWHQSTLIPLRWSNDEDELCLPTCCLVVTLRNLACCFENDGQTHKARAILKQTQLWLHTALQQPNLPTPLIASLLIQQSNLAEHLAALTHRHALSPSRNKSFNILSLTTKGLNVHFNLQ